MALTGDFARLSELRRKLAAIGGGAARGELLRRMANEVHAQIVAGARAQRDPYGRPWAPRKSPPAWAVRAFGLVQDRHPLLDKSGRMLNSIRARATARGVKVTAVGFAGYHQSGTSKMVARRIVPDPAMGLGPVWGEAVNRVAGDVLRGMLSGV